MGARFSGDALMGSLRDISASYSGTNMCDSLLVGGPKRKYTTKEQVC
jgi:hypothetical protein